MEVMFLSAVRNVFVTTVASSWRTPFLGMITIQSTNTNFPSLHYVTDFNLRCIWIHPMLQTVGIISRIVYMDEICEKICIIISGFCASQNKQSRINNQTVFNLCTFINFLLKCIKTI